MDTSRQHTTSHERDEMLRLTRAERDAIDAVSPVVAAILVREPVF